MYKSDLTVKTILVVEDDPVLRGTVAEQLRLRDYRVFEANDGETGLQMAREQLPHLVICDLSMPGIDGLKVLKALRSDPATTAIPFILMKDAADQTSSRAGADDYLVKPFSHAELLKAVRFVLGRSQQLQDLTEAKLIQMRSNLRMLLSHELLTSLSGIIGLSDLLVSDCAAMSPQEVSSMANGIHQSGERLLHQIHNFLLIVDLDWLAADPTGRISVPHGKTASAKAVLLAKAKATGERWSRMKDLTLELCESTVAMKEEFLTKVVEELVDNAFKFSVPGAVVSLTASNQTGRFRLSVRDSGRGLTPEQIAQIGPFCQFDRKRYAQPGLGLGLAITKKLVELHGGEITIQSAVGVGTTVEVSLPV